MNKEKLWTKDFVTVSIINFLIAIIFYMLMVTIASYAVDEYHTSTSIAGLVAGIFIIGALFGRLASGRIIEDIGSKRLLMAGALFFIFTSALYFGTTTLPLLLINRFLHGMAFGVTTTAAGTIVAKIIPHNRRGEGIGYYSMSVILAAALGPFAGILLIHYVDYQMIFIVTLLSAVIIFAISCVVSEPVHKSFMQDQESTLKRFHISHYLELKAIPISLVTLIIGFNYSGIITFISLYSKEIHLEKAASFFFIVYAVAVLVSRPFSGRLLDVKGANVVLYPCLFIFAIGILLLSQAGHGMTLLLAGAIIGLGYGNFLSCAQAISIKVTPPHRLGLATATYFIFLDLGFGIGPYLLGFLIPFTGYRCLYIIIAVVTLADMVLYYFLYGRKVSVE
jgi:MFS family permease